MSTICIEDDSCLKFPIECITVSDFLPSFVLGAKLKGVDANGDARYVKNSYNVQINYFIKTATEKDNLLLFLTVDRAVSDLKCLMNFPYFGITRDWRVQIIDESLDLNYLTQTNAEIKINVRILDDVEAIALINLDNTLEGL